jgi:hypothetical protein
MKNQEIYVILLDEGTDTIRPTKAEVLPNGLYKLLPTPNYDPEDEHWEFPPGSIVKGIWRESEDIKLLLAIKPDDLQ